MHLGAFFFFVANPLAAHTAPTNTTKNPTAGKRLMGWVKDFDVLGQIHAPACGGVMRGCGANTMYIPTLSNL